MRNRAGRTLLAVFIALGLLSVVGCSKPGNQGIVSAWPKANAERAVPRPADEVWWPLTGLKAPSAAAVRRRVAAVKIENSAAARPQTGLWAADVVYETITEGGITRFNAMFHSNRPPVIGPVRSARMPDTHIVPQYDALFFFSGASTYVNGQIRKKTKIENLSEDAGVSQPYYRGTDKPAPHNLYLRTNRIDSTAKARGMKLARDIRGFAFDRSGETTGPTVTEVTVPFSDAATSRWVYDSSTKRYRRFQNGSRHVDKANGKQYAARNVIVLWAKQQATGHADVTGSQTYDYELVGKNRVSIFRDGMRFDGVWGAGRNSPPSFRATDGTPIRLAPGNTWIQVVPTSVNVSMK